MLASSRGRKGRSKQVYDKVGKCEYRGMGLRCTIRCFDEVCESWVCIVLYLKALKCFCILQKVIIVG